MYFQNSTLSPSLYLSLTCPSPLPTLHLVVILQRKNNMRTGICYIVTSQLGIDAELRREGASGAGSHC